MVLDSDEIGGPKHPRSPIQPPAGGRAGVIGPRRYGRQILYRIITDREPRLSDFYSDKASGEEPGYAQREFPELYESLSMWDDARYATTRAAVRGKRVVRIIVPAAATAHDVAVHSTPNAEHHVDVWAAPSRLLSMARNVLPDRAQRR